MKPWKNQFREGLNKFFFSLSLRERELNQRFLGYLALWTAGLLVSTGVVALESPAGGNVPGGIVFVRLPDSKGQDPRVYYQGRRAMVIRRDGVWHAIVGIPLSAAPGTHTLTIENGQQKTSQSFQVKPKTYAVQRLVIKDERKVEPLPADLERIERETKIIERTKAHWRNADNVSLDLTMPAEGPFSSPFGLRRFFNGQPRNPHSGLDIAAAQGTPIGAAAPGRVLTTGDFFFNGKSVFIDHGQGLITMYCHMHHIDVKPGQDIKRGQRIGTVGMTGRATGAHLHLSVILNQTMVDPVFLLPPANASFSATEGERPQIP